MYLAYINPYAVLLKEEEIHDTNHTCLTNLGQQSLV